eukprot:sb/3467850/
MKWRFFKRLRYRPIGKISAGRLCSCVAKQQESSEASVDGPDDEEDNGVDQMQEEEVFDWPATPPNELEIDTSELFGESDRSASLARTVDHVVEMFSAVTKRKEDTASPLPGGSNWRTIQKLVVHTNGKYIISPDISIGLRYVIGFFEVVTPLLSRGVVFVRDSPHLLSLFGKRQDITGKRIILGVCKSLGGDNFKKSDFITAADGRKSSNDDCLPHEVVTPLLSRGVVFVRDSPHLLSLFGKRQDITGKRIILGSQKQDSNAQIKTRAPPRGVTTSKNPTL